MSHVHCRSPVSPLRYVALATALLSCLLLYFSARLLRQHSVLSANDRDLHRLPSASLPPAFPHDTLRMCRAPATRRKPKSSGDGDDGDDAASELAMLTDATTPYAPGHPANATAVLCHVLLAALLVVSATIALFDVCKDRLCDKNHHISELHGAGGRRCSLADLTVSRHARRESIQQMHHQMFNDQSSHQRPHGHKATLQRRSSFPANMSAPSPPKKAQKQGSFGGFGNTMEYTVVPNNSNNNATNNGTRQARRTSVDLSEEDSSPDVRRRIRMLRRH